MSIIERTLLLHEDESEIERSDRRLYTIDELRAGGGDITSRAFENALETLAEWVMEWEWWEFTIDAIADRIKNEYGITTCPKDYTFDTYRREFCFGKTSEVDERVLCKKAGLDLRRREVREVFGNLVIGVHYGWGHEGNWIGYPSYESWPSYVDDKVAEALDECLRDACHDALKMLLDEEEYLTSEEHLVETAQANEYLWTRDGRRP